MFISVRHFRGLTLLMPWLRDYAGYHWLMLTELALAQVSP